jgi:peroxiredoxin
MDKDLSAVLGSVRSKRYTLVVENNVVKQIFEGLVINIIIVFDSNYYYFFKNQMELDYHVH